MEFFKTFNNLKISKILQEKRIEQEMREIQVIHIFGLASKMNVIR